MPNPLDPPEVTVTVRGDVRRAAAIVETSVIDLTKNDEGTLEGARKIEIVDPVHLALTLTGEAGAAFVCTLEIGGRGAVTRKGRLKNDYALRGYDIKLEEFA